MTTSTTAPNSLLNLIPSYIAEAPFSRLSSSPGCTFSVPPPPVGFLASPVTDGKPPAPPIPTPALEALLPPSAAPLGISFVLTALKQIHVLKTGHNYISKPGLTPKPQA